MRFTVGKRRKKRSFLSLACVIGTLVLGLLAHQHFSGKLLLGAELLLFFLCGGITLYCKRKPTDVEEDGFAQPLADETAADGEEDASEEELEEESAKAPLSTREKLEICAGDVAVVLFLFLLGWADNFTFAGGFYLTAFWPVALMLALVAGVAVVKKFFWNSSMGMRVFFLLFWGVASYVVVSVCAANLNYVLDLEAPSVCVAEIEEKDHTESSKGRDSYEFQVTVDGKTFDLEVSAITYRAHEVGDDYSFLRYEGAFGVPFYLPLY